MLILVILAVVWAAVLVPPWLRSRQAGPGGGMGSVVRQLDALARRGRELTAGVPGPALGATAEGRPPVGAPTDGRPGLLPRSAMEARRRRVTVLASLVAATVATFALGLAVGGPAYLLFVLCLLGLAGYGFLVANHRSTQRMRAKVAPLRPPLGVAVGAPRWAPSGMQDEAVLRRRAN